LFVVHTRITVCFQTVRLRTGGDATAAPHVNGKIPFPSDGITFALACDSDVIVPTANEQGRIVAMWS
jgi:hypothetical protein